MTPISQPMVRPIQLHGKPVAAGKSPLVSVALVGHNAEQIRAEAVLALASQADILEWRVDYFKAIGDSVQVLAVLAEIRRVAGKVPLIFTCRSVPEGGQQSLLTEAEVLALYRSICQSGLVDVIDFEMNRDPVQVAALREDCHSHDIALILSFHDFAATPALEAIVQRFLQAQQMGADIAKVAVMPHQMEDVLTLLAATQAAHHQLSIPLISMAMGGLGSISRVYGWAFGSALTFAAGQNASAPGQLPIDELNATLAVVKKSMAAQSTLDPTGHHDGLARAGRA